MILNGLIHLKLLPITRNELVAERAVHERVGHFD